MKIAVAQLSSLTGNLQSNLEKHIRWTARAAQEGANIILFPELSLSAYEPTLAKQLAIGLHDPFFDPMAAASRTFNMSIIAGAPLATGRGVEISAVIFQPDGERAVYAKRYLHPDEDPYFVRGNNPPNRILHGVRAGISICYEVSVDHQNEEIIGGGAAIYLASVAKFKNGIAPALEQLGAISKRFQIPVCLSNAVGEADGNVCAGRSSVWDNTGNQVGEMDQLKEGFLLFDYDNNVCTITII
jgi:predicted amidohydrolase